MPSLSVNNISKSFGTESIFSNVNFEIQKNDHVGLVGINGSGKTTLFKVITGEYAADTGSIVPGNSVRIGYMEQQLCTDDSISAYDEVLKVFSQLIAMENELEKINHTLLYSNSSQSNSILIDKQTRLNEQFIDEGGLTYRSRTKSAMIGLGFAENELFLPVGYLSGGQRGKLQLAKLLLSKSDLMLLDEPTNHLDIDSSEWLEEFLRNYQGAFIVISHDRYFLDAVTNRIFEIENGRLESYRGNYSAFSIQKSENILSAQRSYESKIKEIKRIEGIIEQQKRFNQERNYITIASKQKSIDKLKEDLVKPDVVKDDINFTFPESQRGPDTVLTVKNISQTFDEKALFSNVNFEISRGERVFLIGPNGCGKTTLLKIILGINCATTGSCKIGDNIDTGYYDQTQDSLDNSKSVIDEIWDMHPELNQTQIRKSLAVFLFKGEDVFKPVSGLSGGERARLLLLKLMFSQTNFLILDEPTNHLDIASREALEDALLGYKGTMLIVSHDRYLINRLSTRILFLSNNGITEYEGNYDNYIESRSVSTASQSKTSKNKEISDYQINKERRSLIRKKRTALEKCEKMIEEKEKNICDLEDELYSPDNAADYEKSLKISEEIEEIKKENDALLKEWESLSNWIESNDSSEENKR
jgi:ATP-binding cassette subfamily F protein 3